MIRIAFFKRPNGERETVHAPERSPEIEEKARAIISAGFRFEAEILTTGHVHLTITSKEADHASCLCENTFEADHPNGPNLSLDRMISEFDIEEQVNARAARLAPCADRCFACDQPIGDEPKISISDGSVAHRDDCPE